jgi:hypothetical protein
MDNIYVAADLTIVAAGGDDAQAGPLGVEPSTRRVWRTVATLSDELTVLSRFPDYR